MKCFSRSTFLIFSLIILLSPVSSFASLKIDNHASINYGDSIVNMVTDDNSLWIVTSNAGIIRIDKGTMDVKAANKLTTGVGLLSDSINSISTAFNKVFVASNLGLSVIDGDEVTNHEIIAGVELIDCQVTSNDTHVVIAGISEKGGLILYDGKSFKKIFFYNEEVANIESILLTKKEFIVVTSEPVIFKIPVDMLGSATEWEFFELPTSMFSNPTDIKKIASDNLGVLWIVTDNELFSFNGKRCKKEILYTIGGSSISDIIVSGDGFKYLATEQKGLIVNLNGREKRIDTLAGLSSNSVSAVTTDGETVFISTKKGIDSFSLMSVEQDRVDCLSCHTPGGNDGILEKVDREFLSIGNIKTNVKVKSGHDIVYRSDADLTQSRNNECLKCHGRMHPTPNSIVVNVDSGEGYAKGSNNRKFCLSCHDFSFEEEAPVTTHQLKYIVPVNVAKYYNITGHGAKISLSDGETAPANNDCSACHTHHASSNASLIEETAKYPLSSDDIYNATMRDNFCKTRCHDSLVPGAERVVNDHTFERNREEERDHTGCPEPPCDTHPSNSPIPTTKYFKYPSAALPLSGYTTYDGLNSGYIVCTTCHDVHGTSPSNEPSPDKQMIRLGWTEFNTLCNECHK